MKNLMVRTHTFTMLTSRLVAIALFAALLSAAPFHAALAATAPNLRTASTFAVLGATTVTNAGATVIIGDLGVSPGSAITGFDLSANTIVGVPPGTVTGGLGIVNGTIYAGGPVAAQAHIDAVIAYTYLMAQVPDTTYSGVTQLGGLTLTPGVYKFAPSANLNGTLTLDFQGDPDALFIFQMGTTLVTTADSKVIAIDTGTNSQPCLGSNVYWAVGSSATIDGAEFLGTVIAYTTITMTSAANTPPVTDVTGRMLALGGAVTMVTDNISVCGSFPPPPPVPPPGEDSCQDCSDYWNYYWNNYWNYYWKDNCKDCCKHHDKDKKHCNQGVGNGPEDCDPGHSNQGNPDRSNDERGGTPKNPGRKGGNK